MYSPHKTGGSSRPVGLSGLRYVESIASFGLAQPASLLLAFTSEEAGTIDKYAPATSDCAQLSSAGRYPCCAWWLYSIYCAYQGAPSTLLSEEVHYPPSNACVLIHEYFIRSVVERAFQTCRTMDVEVGISIAQFPPKSAFSVSSIALAV